MIEIRKAVYEDAITIIKTRQKAWDTTYRGIYPDEMIDQFDYTWHLEAERRRLMNPDFHCVIVLDEGSCVGYVSFGTVCPGTWKDFAFRLHSLYLLPPYQGTGLGRKLFGQVRAACKAMGYDKLFLDCHPDNHGALGFYRHMGGVITRTDGGHENSQEDTCTIEYHFT